MLRAEKTASLQVPDAPRPIRGVALTAEQTSWLLAARSGVISRLAAASEGVPPTTQDRFGTALHWAAAGDHRKVIEWLLAHEIPLSLCNVDGQSAIHVAAFFGFSDSLEALLAARVEPESQAGDKRGFTPVHYAAVGGHVDALKKLLATGASPFAKSADDKTALQLARREAGLASGARQTAAMAAVRLLERACAQLRNWLRAVRADDLEMCSVLYDDHGGSKFRGVNPDWWLPPSTLINSCEVDGRTALHIAARATSGEMVTWLLAHGADPSLHDVGRRWTPLHVAVAARALRVVRLLLVAGRSRRQFCAVSALKPSYGHSALELAASPLADWESNDDARAILALLISERRRCKLLRQWRLTARLAVVLQRWQLEAAARAYAPQGMGYMSSRDDFAECAREEIASKRQRQE